MTVAYLSDVILAILKVIDNREYNHDSRDFTLTRNSIGPSKDEVISYNSLGDRRGVI